MHLTFYKDIRNNGKRLFYDTTFENLQLWSPCGAILRQCSTAAGAGQG